MKLWAKLASLAIAIKGLLQGQKKSFFHFVTDHLHLNEKFVSSLQLTLVLLRWRIGSVNLDLKAYETLVDQNYSTLISHFISTYIMLYYMDMVDHFLLPPDFEKKRLEKRRQLVTWRSKALGLPITSREIFILKSQGLAFSSYRNPQTLNSCKKSKCFSRSVRSFLWVQVILL